MNKTGEEITCKKGALEAGWRVNFTLVREAYCPSALEGGLGKDNIYIYISKIKYIFKILNSYFKINNFYYGKLQPNFRVLFYFRSI